MKYSDLYAELNRLLATPRVKALYQKVKSEFDLRDAIGHNWEHVRRDIVNAVKIGLEEGTDMDIVLPAIILHDIGFVTHPYDPAMHSVHGSKECYRYLDEWDRDQQNSISGCILKHKGRFPGFEHSEPETLEEKVVCDADQVDKFGWVGFLQMMKVYVEHGTQGILRFKTHAGLAAGMKAQEAITLYTEAGRRIASQRREPDFVSVAEQLEKELEVYAGWEEPF